VESLLILGFVFGLKHALEGDHLAAMASLTTQSNSTRETLRMGVVWGLGHTITLFLVGGSALLLDATLSEEIALIVEWIVGLMLVILGGNVIHGLVKARIHFHLHQHEYGIRHFYAHRHDADNYSADTHHHNHSRGFPLKAFLVGLIHGLAGSTVLILLTLNSVESNLTRFSYILVFAFGSLIGMGTLTVIIAVPLQNVRRQDWVHKGLSCAVGLLTLSFGLILIYQVSPAILELVVNKN
jgi:sulfite exporter TauE/SafE|tara:strand:- start:18657 stop:19376 length:720 start_codon:yes stop_codon:yes gene_type:complete